MRNSVIGSGVGNRIVHPFTLVGSTDFSLTGAERSAIMTDRFPGDREPPMEKTMALGAARAAELEEWEKCTIANRTADLGSAAGIAVGGG